VAICSKCGAKLAPGARLCEGCGHLDFESDAAPDVHSASASEAERAAAHSAAHSPAHGSDSDAAPAAPVATSRHSGLAPRRKAGSPVAGALLLGLGVLVLAGGALAAYLWFFAKPRASHLAQYAPPETMFYAEVPDVRGAMLSALKMAPLDVSKLQGKQLSGYLATQVQNELKVSEPVAQQFVQAVTAASVAAFGNSNELSVTLLQVSDNKAALNVLSSPSFKPAPALTRGAVYTMGDGSEQALWLEEQQLLAWGERAGLERLLAVDPKQSLATLPQY
jgi:hypothetical protein